MVMGGAGKGGEVAPQPPILGELEKDREIARLSAALVSREVEGQIGALKAAGRVVPATEGLVRALLSVPASALVTLSGGEGPVPVREVFLTYLQAQTPVVEFMETAGPGGTSAAGGTRSHHHAQGDHKPLTADEEAFLKALGLDPAEVQHMMRHGKLPAGHGTGQMAGKGN